MVLVRCDLAPAPHGRLRIRAVTMRPASRGALAVRPRCRTVTALPGRFRHLPQAQCVDESELREPEPGLLEHLHGSFRQVEARLRWSARVTAICRIFEALGERHFQQDGKVVVTVTRARVLVPDPVKPPSELLPGSI